MTTLDDVETAILGKPIEVKASNKLDLFLMVVRYLGSAGGALVALGGFASRRDWSGLFAYLQGEELAGAVGAIVMLGFMAWGAAKIILNKKALVTTANAAPDHVAVVKP